MHRLDVKNDIESQKTPKAEECRSMKYFSPRKNKHLQLLLGDDFYANLDPCAREQKP